MAAAASCAAPSRGTCSALHVVHGACSSVRVAALLVLVARYTVQADSPASDSWNIRCSQSCNGKDLCARACVGEQTQMGKCPSTAECPKPDASVCAGGPVACKFSDWGDWAADDDCTGLCTRKRKIASPNKCGGTPCGGTLEDTKRCSSTCNPATDCSYADWSHWTACGAKTPNQRERTRKINKYPKGNGKGCQGSTIQTKECGSAATPGADCEVTDWFDWSACNQPCGGGHRNRVRTITKRATGGGDACPEALAQTDGCNNGACSSGDGSPADCTFGPWAEWDSCISGNQKTRKRVVQSPLRNGGKACDGPTVETGLCKEVATASSAQDCILDDWSPWNLCDKTCDGGQTYRQRKIKVEPRNGGKTCMGPLKETKACSTHSCDTTSENDCVMSAWSAWTKCSRGCGTGSQNRTRTIVAQAHSGGTGCNGPLAQTRGCPDNPSCGVQDCVLSDWGAWDACSATCGSARKRRKRVIVTSADAGGKPCDPGHMSEYDTCNLDKCPTDCVDGAWNDWGDWSTCTKTCKGGYHQRSRSIKTPGTSCGVPLSGSSTEFMSCNADIICLKGDFDCSFSLWSDWGPCTATCLGVRNRTRRIAQHGSGSGSYCGSEGQGEALSMVETCGPPEGYVQSFGDDGKSYADACGISTLAKKDCTVGIWSEWSDCSATCNGGQKRRSRKIATMPEGWGKACKDALEETEPCNQDTKCQDQADCVMSEWSTWGDCLGCTGQKYRTRSVKTDPKGAGQGCKTNYSQEIGGCEKICGSKTSVSPYFCIWTTWSTWSSCSQTLCGNGTRLRYRQLASTDAQPMEYAAIADTPTECQGKKEERGACHLGVCDESCKNPQDCVLNDWSEWSTPTCQGLCSRNRSIKTPASNCGKPCTGSLHGTMECPSVPPECGSPKDCKLSEWMSWSACSSPNAQKGRERSITTIPALTGKGCDGSLSDTESCSAKPGDTTPRDCELSDWNAWSECDRTCDGGQMMRKRGVQQDAANQGDPCTGGLSQTAACNTEKCPGQTDTENDCKFGPWSVWSSCNTTAGDVQSHRERHILKEAVQSGAACVGNVKETMSCKESVAVDCTFSDWTGWGQCSMTCKGGKRIRARTIANYASNGGKLCTGELVHMEPCLADKSCGPPQDCVLDPWSDWSTCIPSGTVGKNCGDGHKVRVRKVKTAPGVGGKPCETSLREVGTCRDAVCEGSQDCKWQEWADWEPCVKAEGPCGVGYKRRTRGIAQLPFQGGSLCKPRIKDELSPVINCQGQKQCCIDAKWGDWNEWSECSATCGGASKKRSRKLARNATECGKSADGSNTEYKFCENANCSLVDCEFGEWGKWSPDISVACPGPCSQGHVERSREIKKEASRSGKPCSGPMHEWRRCPYDNKTCTSTHPPSQDCVLHEWSPWTHCSKYCDTGYMTRNRSVKVWPKYDGKNCSGNNHLKEVKACNVDVQCEDSKAKVNCAWTEWTSWSECTHGEQTSTRGVKTHASHGGAPCVGAQNRTQACGHCVNHTYTCEWADWGDWGDCSQTCGTGGKRSRRRSAKVGVKANGTERKYSLSGVTGAVARAGPNRLQEFALAFGAGAAVLAILTMVVRPLVKQVRTRTQMLAPRSEETVQRPAYAEVNGVAARSRPSTYAPILIPQAALLEEGPME